MMGFPKCIISSIFASALLEMLRKTAFFIYYSGIIFVPIIVYAYLIVPLKWSNVNYGVSTWRPTDESMKKFKEISI